MKPLVDPSAYKEQMSPMWRKLDILSDMFDRQGETPAAEERKWTQKYKKQYKKWNCGPDIHLRFLLSQKSKKHLRNHCFELHPDNICNVLHLFGSSASYFHDYWDAIFDSQFAFADKIRHVSGNSLTTHTSIHVATELPVRWQCRFFWKEWVSWEVETKLITFSGWRNLHKGCRKILCLPLPQPVGVAFVAQSRTVND